MSDLTFINGSVAYHVLRNRTHKIIELSATLKLFTSAVAQNLLFCDVALVFVQNHTTIYFLFKLVFAVTI